MSWYKLFLHKRKLKPSRFHFVNEKFIHAGTFLSFWAIFVAKDDQNDQETVCGSHWHNTDILSYQFTLVYIMTFSGLGVCDFQSQN